MSYNGSGTFQINTSGQPVVAGTVISSTAFNALTADLATGLSTAITKDGQTTTTARIPFAAGINSSLTTDSTSTATGSIITAGGVGIAKALYVGTTANIAGVATFSAGTAALPAITTTGDTNTGIFFPAADTIAFAEGGAEIARFDSSGNLGIGTSSPNTKLTVGTPNTQTVALAGSFSGATPAIATGIGMVTVNSTDTVAVDKGGVLSFTANTTTLSGYAMGFIAGKYETAGAGVYSGYLQFGTSNSAGTIAERMRINSSGNVGIGTSSPVTLKSATTLQVLGNIKAGSVDGAGLVSLGDTSSTGGNAGIWRGAAGAYGSTGNYLNLGGYDGITFTTGNADIASQTERMRITSAGVLLVGRTTQTSSEKVCFEYSSSVGPGLTVNNSVSGGGTAIQFSTAGSGVGNITTGTTNTAYNTSSDYRLKNTITSMTGALAKVALLKPVTYKWNID